MSEQEAADALDYLVSRGRDPLARRLDVAPLDDEPLIDEECESLRDARADKAAGRLVSMDDLRRSSGDDQPLARRLASARRTRYAAARPACASACVTAC
jgi:hypothetical protein